MDKHIIEFMINTFLNLQKLINLENQGKKIQFTEIVINKKYHISHFNKTIYQNIETVYSKEPRIKFIHNFLIIFFNIFKLKYNDEDVIVDGFSLRAVNHWLIPLKYSNPYILLQYLAYPCKANCIFCFQKGNPEMLKIAQKKTAQRSELLTRVKYYSEEFEETIFNQASLNIDEVLTNPYLNEILPMIRKKTKSTFSIQTNGNMLNEEMVNFLKQMEPVYLGVSLNSVRVETRKTLMNDINSCVAIKSLELLKNKQIHYYATIAWWPTISLDEFIETAKYAEKMSAAYLRIFLPSFTDYYKLDKNEISNHWKYAIDVIDYVRNSINIPVDILPSLYEAYIKRDYKQIPIITGMMLNSPAVKSDLRIGDVITGINEFHIKNRSECIDVLNKLRYNKKILVEYRRNNNTYTTILTDNRFVNTYPYFYTELMPFGIQLLAGINFEKYKNFIIKIKKDNIKKVLILTSVLLKPFLETYLLNENLENYRIDIEVPKNKSLGGNIIVDGMYSVNDYIAKIKDWIDVNGTPQLIVIPSTAFSERSSDGWRRDMFGDNYRRIERVFGVPVQLIYYDYLVPF